MRKEYIEYKSGAAPRMSLDELSRIIDFVEQMDDEAEEGLDLRRPNRELRILAQMMRDHISGRLTTQSSLIAASGLPYGTALRLLQELYERGQFYKRPRTRTGKSFSLHPTEKLIEQWRGYGRRVKAVIGSSFGLQSQRHVIDGYYFGASYMCTGVVPQPTVLKQPLSLSTLRILIHADPTFMAMSAVKTQVENVLGTCVRTKALSIDRLLSEIEKNARQTRSSYDIISCDLPWFGKLASEKRILPLDEFVRSTSLDILDFYPEAVESAQWQGTQYGIPVQSSPELLTYRKDLFAEAGLSPPRTTQDVLDAARTLHKPHQGLSGIAWNAARGTPLGHSFIMLMGAFGQPVINLRRTDSGFRASRVLGEEHRPMMLSDQAFAVAEYMKELLSYSPSKILSMSWYERAKSYASGECAMSYCYSLIAAIFTNDASSPAHGKTGFLPHPAGAGTEAIAPVGGYALAIPANIDEDRIDDAWTAIRTLTSPELLKQYVLNGSTTTSRFSVGRDPEISAVCPLMTEVEGLARRGELQYWPRPPIPEIVDIVSVVGKEIFLMLSGEVTVRVALETTQNRLDALMRARGHY